MCGRTSSCARDRRCRARLAYGAPQPRRLARALARRRDLVVPGRKRRTRPPRSTLSVRARHDRVPLTRRFTDMPPVERDHRQRDLRRRARGRFELLRERDLVRLDHHLVRAPHLRRRGALASPSPTGWTPPPRPIRAGPRSPSMRAVRCSPLRETPAASLAVDELEISGNGSPHRRSQAVTARTSGPLASSRGSCSPRSVAEPAQARQRCAGRVRGRPGPTRTAFPSPPGFVPRGVVSLENKAHVGGTMEACRTKPQSLRLMVAPR